MENIKTNKEKTNELFIQNNELKKQNMSLMEQINTEIRPLKDENQRMKTIIEKMRSTEKALTDDHNRIFSENEILKKTSKRDFYFGRCH